MFIFISGFTAGLVYGRIMLHDGPLIAGARIYRRAWQIYVAQLCLFVLFSAEIAYAIQYFNRPMLIDDLGISDFPYQANSIMFRVLTLQYQPEFLDILPLYISLLIVFPFFMLAMRVHPLLALAPSLLLYLLAQRAGINLPAYPAGIGWTFNPFAWQFLFVIGGTLGFARAHGRDLGRPGPVMVALAVAVAVAGMLIQGSWTLHQVFPLFPGILMQALSPLDKGTLSIIRVANLLALAVLVAAFVPQGARFLTGRAAWPVVLCGQHALHLFCFATLLSMLGTIVFTFVGRTLPIQLAVNAAGIVAMVGLALLCAWYKAGARLPRRPGAWVAVPL